MPSSKVLVRFPQPLKDNLQKIADKYYLSFADILKIAAVQFVSSLQKEDVDIIEEVLSDDPDYKKLIKINTQKSKKYSLNEVKTLLNDS